MLKLTATNCVHTLLCITTAMHYCICTQILQGWGKGHGLKREVDDVSNDVAGDAPNDASSSVSSSMQQHSAAAAAGAAAGDSAAAQIQSMKRRRSNSVGVHTSEVCYHCYLFASSAIRSTCRRYSTSYRCL
jgi:hypothetical protein